MDIKREIGKYLLEKVSETSLFNRCNKLKKTTKVHLSKLLNHEMIIFKSSTLKVN